MTPGSPAVDPDWRADGDRPREHGVVEPAPIRILLVDDSDRNLAALEALLGDLDAEVVTARSGAEALRALLRQDFALILLDVRMPGMDGFETAELIRSRDRTRLTPIIFVTAYDRPRHEELRGYALGAVDFLSKPIVPEVLRGKVAVVIELQRKTEEIRRQAMLLDEARRRAHARALEVERRRWEQDALRARIERERQTAEVLQRANAQLTLLSETASDLLFLPGPEPEHAVEKRVFGRVARLLGLELGMWHRRESDGPLVPVAVVGFEPGQAAALGLDANPAGPIGEAVASGRRQLIGSLPAAGIGAGVVFPLIIGARVDGVLTFATRVPHAFSNDEIATLDLLARAVVATLERWQLLRELREGAIQLKEADLRKDRFLAMLGHELRNPLAPVLNAVKLMIESAPAEGTFQRVIAAADRQIRHMTRLLDDLLDVSRIRNGKIELKRAPVDLRVAVHDALLATETAVAERGHTLVIHLPDEAMPVHGDAVRLAQVFSNLIHNAAKYTDRGGHIELRVEREGDDIAVIVRDDGIGIAEEMLPRIFEVFVQVDQGPDRAMGGLGLGLTLVRSLVEMHGGEVRARSAGLGAGSEFEVRLPALPEESVATANVAGASALVPTRPPDATPAPRGANGHPRHPLRIVLVDDNADIRDSLKALLEHHGHAVDDAEDGRAGIEMIRARNPEVALVDIGLPGIDGYEVARQLRAGNALTRLVAMTGYGRPEDRRLALDAGFDAHLVKPVDFDALTNLLYELTQPEQRSAP